MLFTGVIRQAHVTASHRPLLAVRVTHKPKRNFMKLLDKIKP
jgi:hypothetical protein